MEKRLNLPMSRLLQEVAKKRGMVISAFLKDDGTWVLGEADRKLLSDALTTELAKTGFDRKYESNERGRALEDLIDWLFNYDRTK